MEKVQYTLTIEKDTDGLYAVSVPECKGCFSNGATARLALRNGVDALEVWLEAAGFDLDASPTLLKS